MEPESRAVSPYLLVFRDCFQAARSETSPREIGTVLAKWIEWHDALAAEGKIRFCGAIGPEIRRLQQPNDADRYRAEEEQRNPIVGYLLVDATNFDEATKIAAACPGLRHGFTVEVCKPIPPL